MAKAVGLISGGLDSVLAAKILLEQGMDICGICFVNPFGSRCDYAVKAAKQLGIPIKLIELGEDYLEIIKKPRHGVGAGMNPCVDCRIFMLKKAKDYANKIGARFIFSGEVLGQRPMSQTKSAIELIGRKSGVEVLRPLSAKLLPETEAEKNKYVCREKLFDISGRRREKQLALAKKYNLIYASPAGGCLLCEKDFSKKLKDLFEHKKKVDLRDIEFLKVGRHFRVGNDKIVVGRDEKENEKLLELKGKKDIVVEAKDIPGPVTILQGNNTNLAARITMRYADADEGIVNINGDEVKVKAVGDSELEQYRIK